MLLAFLLLTMLFVTYVSLIIDTIALILNTTASILDTIPNLGYMLNLDRMDIDLPSPYGPVYDKRCEFGHTYYGDYCNTCYDSYDG